jgi:hypothetical protein
MKPSEEPVRLGRAPESKLEAFKEVLRCVPDDQAKKLVDAYRRGDTITESLISMPELVGRGWTRAMFKFLPEAVAVRCATAYWLLSRVEGIERTDEWKAASARAAVRRAAQRRRHEVEQGVMHQPQKKEENLKCELDMASTQRTK